MIEQPMIMAFIVWVIATAIGKTVSEDGDAQDILLYIPAYALRASFFGLSITAFTMLFGNPMPVYGVILWVGVGVSMAIDIAKRWDSGW